MKIIGGSLKPCLSTTRDRKTMHMSLVEYLVLYEIPFVLCTLKEGIWKSFSLVPTSKESDSCDIVP